MEEPDVYFKPQGDGPLQNRSVEFARCVRRVCHSLVNQAWVDKSAIQQLYRAGTSVGANIREAKFAESRRDFVHKLKIAEKELAEFYFWIGLLHDNPSAISEENTGTLLDLAADTRHLLKSIIIATRRNSGQ